MTRCGEERTNATTLGPSALMERDVTLWILSTNTVVDLWIALGDGMLANVLWTKKRSCKTKTALVQKWVDTIRSISIECMCADNQTWSLVA
jgi:hypothetical protein